jgi:hypothetical protein
MGGTYNRHGNINEFAVGKQKGTELLSHVSVDGRMILKEISR